MGARQPHFLLRPCLQRRRPQRPRADRDEARRPRLIESRYGKLDILVNNAGYGLFKPLVDTAFEELQGVFSTNVFGAFLMAREAARQFILTTLAERIGDFAAMGAGELRREGDFLAVTVQGLAVHGGDDGDRP